MTLRISGGAGRCQRGIENVLIERREGENLDVLEENLKDILGDLESKEIPLARTYEDMAIQGREDISLRFLKREQERRSN